MATATVDSQIKNLEARVTELQNQRSKLEEELRPHRDRDYREKERVATDKRNAERDAQLAADLSRIETLVVNSVKDPELRPHAFQFALYVSLGPWSMFGR